MPFFMKDCALIARMAGIDTAINLREMRERLLHCPIESIFHHFCETVIRPTFDDPEYRNDFAIWAARDLQDRVLAEQLGIINPYSFHDLEEVRRCVIDIIDDRLSEVTYIPWVKMDNDFRFMRAVTVVFDAGKQFELPEDLVAALPEMSLSSVYYHYVEARRRTENHKDDFTVWLSGFGSGTEGLIEALGCIDFYFMSLPELKACLVRAVAQFKGEPAIG
ncbi:MAG: hypothetical protein DRP45_08215 [Candidatus Zixiibacteriota bacterium]|nr:MAG: hypothetical protein DRP45_08215 [candidate division Zixibacteria bacterium]